jgi:copper(I)-binding protein
LLCTGTLEKTLNLNQYIFAALLCAGALGSSLAQSEEVKLGDLVLTQAWVRAAPKGSELTSGYLTIENKGASANRLLGGATDVAEKLQIQKTSKSGGATAADPLADGLAIAPGEKIALAPGSYKLALLKLKTKLKKGTQLPMSLEFEEGGMITVPFDVLSPAAVWPVASKMTPKAGADGSKMKQ